ncbi:MAG: class I SAM-dependent methyltransferase [Caldilineales bacterium]|nr:class I SAM-dependent methyltransferase [Caldilineales bacterium]MDW8316687.1 class I SAM-dependent methyltransferase [Anaerolineae bacterium]
MSSSYQQHVQTVATAFDRAAATYDAQYGSNASMAWMRAEALAAMQRCFPPGGRLLEIGCGTGQDALTLRQAGFGIVATDISPAMVQQAQAKAAAAGVADIRWHVLPAGRLGELLDAYGPAAFDGAYSNFGPLNGEPRLEPVAAALARLLRPAAALVATVMGRWCAWEIGWGLLHLRPRQALRRLHTAATGGAANLAAPEGALPVPTRFYTPGEFARPFAEAFAVQEVAALPLLLPPPNLAHLWQRFPSLMQRLARAEPRLRGRRPFHSLGDHFLIVLRRRP